MKNTAALYIFSGILLGVIVSKASAFEPAWWILLIPTIISLIAALVMDNNP